VGLEAGWPLDRLVDGFDAQLRSFEALRERYALYP